VFAQVAQSMTQQDAAGPTQGCVQLPAPDGQQQQHAQGAPPGGAIAAVPFTWREPGKGDGDGPLWLLMHLAVRDFFIYSALLHGPGQRPARAQCLPARPRAPAGGHALYLCGRLLNAAPT
jgi:hypothetical protein